MPAPRRPRPLRALLPLVLAASLFAGTARADDALRPEVARPLQAAQELIQAGKAAEALARVREAEAVAGRSPYEVFTTERMKGSAAMLAKDPATAIQAFEAVVEARRLPPAEQLPLLRALAVLSLSAGQPQAAARWARRYFSEGGGDPALRTTLVQALYAADDFAGTAQEAASLVAAEEAAGKAPAEDLLKLLAVCQNKLQDEAGYTRTLEKLVTHHPRPEYWADLLSRIQHQPGFTDRLLLDTFRLMRHTGALEDASEYLDMAQLALLAGLPGEARSVVEQGYAQGLLGKGSAAERHQRLRDKARQLAAEDRAQFAASEATARAARDGAPLVSLGLAALSEGQTDQGLALMQQGLAKGVQRHPEDARLRHAVALLQAGRRAEAEPLLRAITAGDGSGDLARLWLLATR